MSAITVHLTPAEEARAADLVARGLYDSVEEVLREALRRLDVEEEAWGEMWRWDGVEVHLNPDGTRNAALPGPPLTLEELREEIRKGEDSGFIEVTDIDAFFDEIEAEVDAELEAEARGAA